MIKFDYYKKIKKKSIKYYFFIVILILLILFFNKYSFLLYNLKINFFKDFRNSQLIFYDEKILEDNFNIFKNNAVILSNTNFRIINSELEQIFSINHNLIINPTTKISSCSVLIYELGGFNYKIYSGNDRIFSGKSQNKIIDGCISDSGHYGFLTTSVDYISEMIIFDKKNKQRFRFYFSNIYPCGFSIDKKGKNAAICALDSKDSNLQSVIWLFDFKCEIPKNKIEVNDNMLSSIEYFDNSNLISFGDNYIVFINKNGQKKIFDFENYEPIHTYFNKKNGFAFTYSPTNDKRGQIIEVINKNGKKTTKIDSEKELKSISYEKKRITAISGNMLNIYDIYGNLCYQKEIPVSSKKVGIFSNSSAYILGDGGIGRIFFK